ncbi:MAG: hypothetical protein P8183_07335 [Anaerolineae bacterium]
MDTTDSPKKTFSFPVYGGKPKVPSDKETEALAAMKAIKEKVRDLKDRRAVMATSAPDGEAGDIESIEKELARLKADWEMWEEKRSAAARERMILLGHEEGPAGEA